MVRSLRLITAGVVLAALAAACSGGVAAPSVASLVDPAASGASGASPSASASLSPQDAALAYARCMREHGVDMPDPKVTTGTAGEVMIDQVAGTPVAKDKLDKADAACRKFMAAAGPNGPGGHMSAEDLDRLLQFAKCMRGQGVDFPDPNPDGGFTQVLIGDGGTSTTGGPDDPKFQAAQKACGGLLPGKPTVVGGTGPAGGGTTPFGGGSDGGTVTTPNTTETK